MSNVDHVNVLHIFGRMTRGGAEMRTMEIMRQIDRAKFRFSFCVLSGLPGELDDEIRSLGGDVFYLKLGISFPFRFLHLLRDRKIDVVHSHVHLFSGFLLRLAAQHKVPLRIAHFRNTNDGSDNSLRKRAQNHVMRLWIEKHATHILAVCKGAMEVAWGAGWENDRRCRVVYNGFDVGSFEAPVDKSAIRREFGFAPESKVFIHVGRLAEAKNHPRLLKIFQQIALRDKQANLLIVGRGGNSIEDRLRESISHMGLEPRIVLAGERIDIPQLLKAADLMIFPSKWEGLPGTVIEACAAGLPVLASSLPGTEEICAHFPLLVHLLPLTADDSEWCEKALTLVGSTKTLNLSSTPFSGGVFSLDRCISELEEIWSRNGTLHAS